MFLHRCWISASKGVTVYCVLLLELFIPFLLGELKRKRISNSKFCVAHFPSASKNAGFHYFLSLHAWSALLQPKSVLFLSASGLVCVMWLAQMPYNQPANTIFHNFNLLIVFSGHVFHYFPLSTLICTDSRNIWFPLLEGENTYICRRGGVGSVANQVRPQLVMHVFICIIFLC